MRAAVAPIAALFLMFSFTMSQVSARGGILKRKRDSRNEFLEVKDANTFDHINRIKRNLADVLSDSYSAKIDTACDSDTWQCGDKKCIPTTDYCNGVVDCIDGTDEAACNSTTRRSFVLHINNTVPVTTDRPPGDVRGETGITTATTMSTSNSQIQPSRSTTPSRNAAAGNDESNIPSVSTSNSQIQPSRSTTPSRNAAADDFTGLFGSSDDSDDSITTESPGDNAGYGKDHDLDNFGWSVSVLSTDAAVDKTDTEAKEKTVRVTFTVVEPYRKAYSNRDSPEFINFSRSLANAVDQLFENLPGTQRSSLVRILSLINEDFSCKVTLDIMTTGYDNTEHIKDVLKNHITTYNRLGKTTVNENEFSVQVIDSINPEPEVYNITVSVDRLRIPSGGSGTVECNPVGSPLPLIKWTKHEGALGTDSSQRDNSLIINNARQSDEGYYLCEGTVKGVPVASYYVFVEIERREMPVVKIWPEGEQAVILGAQFELHCRVLSGIPEPYVTWNRNGGRPLSPTTEIQTHYILRFNNIDVNDEGEYTCEASNVAGSASASSVIKVRAPPEITITPSDYVSVLRGEPINVDCRANGYPEPTVSISFRNRQLVPPQPGHANLRIPAANVEDEGDYTCTAESVAGSMTNEFLVAVDRGDGGDIIPDEGNDESNIPSVSTSNSQIQPSRWNAAAGKLNTCAGSLGLNIRTALLNQTVNNGDNVIFECHDEGPQRAKVIWSMIGRPIKEGSSNIGGRLEIHNVTQEDAGIYICDAEDFVGFPGSQVRVTLQVNSSTRSGVLDLKSYPHNQEVKYVNAGDDVIFICRDEGPQRARVTWVKYGRPIKEGSSNVRGRLEIYSVTQNDAGTYICEAEDFIGVSGSQVRVTLQVNSSTPKTLRPAFVMCRPNEATCANGQCIPKAGVCDGRIDCADISDEDSCHHASLCEPNQFQCRNGRCVLKTWLCDSENDCSDGSDEENCGTREEGKCAPDEFTCACKNQCISKSFHCDGQSDCLDGSDEIGCLDVRIINGPEPSEVRLDPGDTLILRSDAVGVPTPIISWRLNMGHVPAKCSNTNVNGVGILTCPNIQPEDSGAYSSEAINNRRTTFAPVDAIVTVGNAT